jgi:hypothetical protein
LRPFLTQALSFLPKALLVVVIASASPVLAQPSFPVPITPEIAVSPTTYGWAAGAQTNVHAASNGDVTLVAWSDNRTGIGQAFAARINSDGEVLDRLGIPLEVRSAPVDVVWNGDAFAVVTVDVYGVSQLVFVSVDGTIVGRKSIALKSAQYIAATGSGAGVRLLFLELIEAGGGAAVVDGQGEIVNGSAPIFKPKDGLALSRTAIGGTTTTGFAVLAQEMAPNDYVPKAILIAGLDRDGQPLFSSETHLPFTQLDGSEAVYGGPDGFLVMKSSSDPSVVAYRLDANGVYTGPVKQSGSSDVNNSGAKVEWDGQQYLVASSSFRSGHSRVTLAKIAPGSYVAETKQVADFAGGMLGDLALVHGIAQPFLFAANLYSGWTSGYDVFMQRFTPALDAEQPQMVTFSATRQASAQVATSRSGYAVAWSETGPDQYVHAFVRRFTTTGAPIDSQPIEVNRVAVRPYDTGGVLFVRVASNGTSYAVFWSAAPSLVVRRMVDAPDTWRDPQPVPVPFVGPIDPNELAVATEGMDLLAVGVGPCGNQQCLSAQRIPMTGSLAIPSAVVVAKSEWPTGPSITSNGTDYLVAWADGPHPCPFECVSVSPRILGARLRADGTAIDSAPFVIENAGGSSWHPTVAWNAGRYVVAWQNLSEIRAATVTAEGAVHDVDPTAGGTVVQRQTNCCSTPPPKLVAFNGGFVLLTTRITGPTSFGPFSWEGVAFCGECDLRDVVALPRTTLLQSDHFVDGFGSLDAAGRDNTLVLVYDHPAGADTGFVPRVFARTFAPAVRRRSVTR